MSDRTLPLDDDAVRVADSWVRLAAILCVGSLVAAAYGFFTYFIRGICDTNCPSDTARRVAELLVVLGAVGFVVSIVLFRRLSRPRG